MTRFLDDKTAPDLTKLLTAVARAVDEGVRPHGVIWRANSWFGALPAPEQTEWVSGGGTSNPTSSQAIGRVDWTTTIASDIWHDAEALTRAAHALMSKLRRCEPVHETARAESDLADENIGAGTCQLCGRDCTGRRDDRLTTLTVKEQFTHAGVTDERTYTRRACDACRHGWTRAKDKGEQFLAWERMWQRRIEREAS